MVSEFKQGYVDGVRDFKACTVTTQRTLFEDKTPEYLRGYKAGWDVSQTRIDLHLALAKS